MSICRARRWPGSSTPRPMCSARSIPGMTRLPNGNLLLMVRVAEALREPIRDGMVHAIRWDDGRLRARCLAARARRHRRSAQVPAARRRLEGHGADLAVVAAAGRADAGRAARSSRSITTRRSRRRRSYQCYGVEDARISRVGDRWLMTTCSVSPERHSTTLYTSDNALDWRVRGHRPRSPEQGHADLRRADRRQVLGADAAARRSVFRLSAGQRMARRAVDQPRHLARRAALEAASSSPASARTPDTVATARMGGGTPPILTERRAG